VSRKFVGLLHGGYWSLYVLLLALMFVLMRLPGRPPGTVIPALVNSPIAALSIVPSAAAFYASYWLLFSRFLARRRLAALFFAGLGVCLGAATLGFAVLYAFFGSSQPVFASFTEIAGLGACLAVLAAIHVTIALIMRGFVDWYGDLRVKEALARKTHEMELALVRSRLDPHFLFNTLNNVDVLISRDPAVASEYLNKLSDIIRFVLYETRGDVIPLADELQYIEKYVALEKIRTRTGRYVIHGVTGDPHGLSIAPMTFIPFLENAFKHTEGLKSDGAIVSRIVISGHQVLFECANRRGSRPDAGPEPGGLGNGLIRERLQLLYPGRHTLDSATTGDKYTVRLTIDTHDPLHPH
jgi:two-component system, LytTR family, sensor kinase